VQSGNPFGPGAGDAQEPEGGQSHASDVAEAVGEVAQGASDGCSACDGCDGCDCSFLALRLCLHLAVIALASLLLPARGRGKGLNARLLHAVHRYRREVSPKHPPCCRYTPTCSTYAVTALQRHGVARGGYLTFRRLRRCRPGAGRGHDPVPA
jgi:hypothetical protein